MCPVGTIKYTVYRLHSTTNTKAVLYLPRVHDESDAVDGDGGLGDVGGDDALPDALRRVVKHLLLIRHRQRTVQRQDDPLLHLTMMMMMMITIIINNNLKARSQGESKHQY